MNKIYYDISRYALYVDGIYTNRCLIRARYGMQLRLVSKESGEIFEGSIFHGFRSQNIVLCELAGGISILVPILSSKRVLKKSVYEARYDGDYVHIEYDGITHLTIEDEDYIFIKDMYGYVDIDVKYEDNVYLIRYDMGKMHYLMIIKKNIDYYLLLDVMGDDISIDDNGIIVSRYFADSLGRVREDTYIVQDGKYQLSSRQFRYTYDVVYSHDMRAKLIEDAVYAEDYEYIAYMMDGDISSSMLEDYFVSELGHLRYPLAVDILDDSMRFVVPYRDSYHIVNIKVVLGDSGGIVNFDRTSSI